MKGKDEFSKSNYYVSTQDFSVRTLEVQVSVQELRTYDMTSVTAARKYVADLFELKMTNGPFWRKDGETCSKLGLK